MRLDGGMALVFSISHYEEFVHTFNLSFCKITHKTVLTRGAAATFVAPLFGCRSSKNSASNSEKKLAAALTYKTNDSKMAFKASFRFASSFASH